MKKPMAYTTACCYHTSCGMVAGRLDYCNAVLYGSSSMAYKTACCYHTSCI